MSRRSVFGSLLGLIFVANLARVVFAPLIEPIRAATGASDATLGLTTMVWNGEFNFYVTYLETVGIEERAGHTLL